MIVLDEGPGNAQGPVLVGVKRLEEETTAIAMHVGLDDDHVRQPGGDGPHYTSCSSRRQRYWPYALVSIARASLARAARSMYSMRKAISSRHATIRPCRSSIA